MNVSSQTSACRMFQHAAPSSTPGLPGHSAIPAHFRPSPQVIDHSGARLGEYEDVSKVEKYQMSQEAYDQRQSTEPPQRTGATGAPPQEALPCLPGGGGGGTDGEVGVVEAEKAVKERCEGRRAGGRVRQKLGMRSAAMWETCTWGSRPSSTRTAHTHVTPARPQTPYAPS